MRRSLKKKKKKNLIETSPIMVKLIRIENAYTNWLREESESLIASQT